MKRSASTIGIATLFALFLAMVVIPVHLQAQSAEAPVLRVYQPRFISAQTAAMLAMQVCGGDDACQVQPLGDGQFSLRADPRLQAELEQLLAVRDLPPPTQEFRVILLSADHGDAMPDLPDGARQAVADLREVLPFTGYTVIDSGWLRTSRVGSTTLGPHGAFVVEVQFAGNQLEGARPVGEPLLIERFELVHRPAFGTTEVEGAERFVLGDPEQVITSSFGIAVGETVVVGTSRINDGDRSLVVLLTAVPGR